MSTDSDEFVDDGTREDRPDVPERIPDDAPLREIVPDDFVARSGESTLRDALKAAERATSRAPDELPRCPDCGSVRLRKKAGHLDMTHRKDGQFKCTNCGHHFDAPAPSREAARRGEQATLPGVRER